MVLGTTKSWHTMRSCCGSLNISTEKCITSYWQLIRNFLSACSIVT